MINLTKHDRFWTKTIDCCRQLSIEPQVKFLAAQKLMCYGILFSAFQDYFQTGISTVCLCMSHLVQGITNRPTIADIYLYFPTKWMHAILQTRISGSIVYQEY